MRKITLVLFVLAVAAGSSAYALYKKTDTDPVYYWNHYIGPTYDPVVEIVELSDAEAMMMGCSGKGYKCLVKLDAQLQETDVFYEREVEYR